MYLAEALIDGSGRRHPMVGIVSGVSTLRARATLGYREVVAARDSCLARAGQRVRGHEFHHSTLDAASPDGRIPAYRRVDGPETEGFVAGPRDNVLASYIHVHFGTDPELASRFVSLASGATDCATRSTGASDART